MTDEIFFVKMNQGDDYLTESERRIFLAFFFYKGEEKQNLSDCLLSCKGVPLLIDVFGSVDDVVPMISFGRRVCADVNVLTEFGLYHVESDR